ncbi:hypothetical protein [Timonella sp. A28]|uniref:hypothetical protein n=1 Tax=Timonella sp. A28 TaxID=3442640 RepID=UPI003EB6D3BE
MDEGSAVEQQAHARLVNARRTLELAQLDYNRALKDSAKVLPTRQIANGARIPQTTVPQALDAVAKTPDLLEGFSAASPYELCERYASGLLSRDELLDQLTRWPYPPMPHPDEFGDYTESFNGTFSDVMNANHAGLISIEDYADIVARFTQSTDPLGVCK